jgi:hypothetical protein
LSISGEWFNVDPEAVINQALQTGGGPNVSDAYTINGLPGPFYNCSSKGIKTSFYYARVFIIFQTYGKYVGNLFIILMYLDTYNIYIYDLDYDISNFHLYHVRVVID